MCGRRENLPLAGHGPMTECSTGSDANGDADRGGAVASLSREDRRLLRELALESIETGLATGHPLSVCREDYSSALQEAGAVFVTLEIRGELRGCVGSLSPRRPLVEDVVRNAFGAAFRDSRFPPLSREELPRLALHISRLTPLVPLLVGSREELLEVLRPGVDGLVLEDPPFRATFLPQVWETLSDPGVFVEHLCRKAGLSPDHWSETLVVSCYQVEGF